VASKAFAWGKKLLGDGKISDYSKEPFSFIPPMEGYGFLDSPRRGKPNGIWSAVWTEPGRSKLTRLPSPGREVIVADGPSPMGVTYVLARDRGESPSCFASVLEFGAAFRPVQIAPLSLVSKDGAPAAANSVAFTVTSERHSLPESTDYIIS